MAIASTQTWHLLKICNSFILLKSELTLACPPPKREKNLAWMLKLYASSGGSTSKIKNTTEKTGKIPDVFEIPQSELNKSETSSVKIFMTYI